MTLKGNVGGDTEGVRGEKWGECGHVSLYTCTEFAKNILNIEKVNGN